MQITISRKMKKIDSENNKVAPSGSVINQYVAVIICCSLNLFYGQTVGWASAAIPQLEKGGNNLPSGVNGLDVTVSAWIGGAFCIGGTLSAPFHGLLADALGRKFAAYIVALLFMIHWLMIGLGDNMIWVFIGRGCGGAAAAGSLTISSIYSSEVSEEKHRGRMGGFIALIYAHGIFFSYTMGVYVPFYGNIIIYFVFILGFIAAWWKMPESPAYLLLLGRDEEALKALAWLRKCSVDDATPIMNELKQQQAGAVKAASISKFFKDIAARRALLICCIIVCVQTYSGMFAVNTYASTIFEKAGGILDPFTATLVYGLLMCLGAFIPMFAVDRAGRKVLLGWSCFLLSITLGSMSCYFWIVSTEYDQKYDVVLVILPIVLLSSSVLIYYMGLGSVPYIMMAEMFTDEMRGIGGAIAAITCWFTSFILLQFFSPAVEAYGEVPVFGFFAGVCLFGTIFQYIFLMETRGRTSQDIAEEIASKKFMFS